VLASVSTLLAPQTMPAVGRCLELGGRIDSPLQAELDAVVSDARSAITFLAQNALPVPTGAK
jgi:hypothetical protein